MLRITFSNRFESLQDALLNGIGGTGGPFDATEIIVPSVAVRRRVELVTAERFGIFANIEFSFLAQWLWRKIGQVVSVGELSPFAPSVLAWRVFEILGDDAFVSGHPPLHNYLRNADEVTRYELAIRIAALFDQYITYRSDWLATWLDGKHVTLPDADSMQMQNQRWQAALWRRITDMLGTSRQHPSATFLSAIEKSQGQLLASGARLPATAHVFCLPAIPPLYLEILRGLGRWIDLELYVLNPSRAYWFDIVDRRRLSSLASHGAVDYHEVGNRLLAAWGRQTQALLALLLGDMSEAGGEEDRFEAAKGTSLLCALQNAILELVELEPGACHPLANDDRSVEVHVCHSLTRELEVLHDQLLAMFAATNPPRPADILVVTPDLEELAPMVDAVFRNAPAALRIPYTVTGRARSSVNSAARALLDLLAVATSRFQASAVFELLQQPIISRRFGIDVPSLDAVHAWIKASAIRWGLDAAHRAGFDVPASERHTFKDGLNRLFLAYALPSLVSEPLDDALPAGNVEGSEALVLGSFHHFVDRLQELHEEVAKPKSPAGWQQTFSRALDTFLLARPDDIDDVREVQQAIHDLHDDMVQGGVRQPIAIELARATLRLLLDDPSRGGVPTGAITFSSMTSLRNLPYRVVCVIGLNDGVYPGMSRPAEFDLMALAPRFGDRQPRSDERNAFLDLVLAARDRLYLSYTGRSVRDNSRIPPSVLVSELLDYLVPAIASAPGSVQSLAKARARLLVEHPLQSFSIAYFKPDADPRARSFSDEFCQALKARLAVPADVVATSIGDDAADDADANGLEDIAVTVRSTFFRYPLASPEAEWRDVSLDQLSRFFSRPSGYLLEQRLGIRLPEADEQLQDDEPFLPDYPGRKALGQRLLPALLEGRSCEEVQTLARAGNEYPAGRMGQIELDRELHFLTDFAARVHADSRDPVLPFVEAHFDYSIEGERWRLRGGFGDLRVTGLVRSRYDDVRPTDYLAGWIAHLYLNAMRPPGVSLETRWHSRNGCYVLKPVENAQANMQSLLELYRMGLCAPLHFFPKSAWAYIAGGEKLGKARDVWYGSTLNLFGEYRKSANFLALRGQPDPLDSRFVEASRLVFGPMRAVLIDARVR